MQSTSFEETQHQYTLQHNIVLQHKILEILALVSDIVIWKSAPAVSRLVVTAYTATFSTKSFIPPPPNVGDCFLHIKINYNVLPIELSTGVPNGSTMCSLWDRPCIFTRIVASLCTSKGRCRLHEHFTLPRRLCHWCKKKGMGVFSSSITLTPNFMKILLLL